MAKRKGSSAPSSSRARKKAAEGGRKAKDEGDTRDVESTERRLDKLPPEVWEKILDELDEDDLYPLALSCKYFRQKQKELVARTRQSESESGAPHRALKTNLRRKLEKGQPASADYLEFCSQEKVSREVPRYFEVRNKRDDCVRRLAAYHGHLPLLRDLLQQLEKIDPASLDGHSTAAWLAVRGGQLETLQWLKTQKGIKLDKVLFTSACNLGHLEILKWLRSEGCPWDASTCAYAAADGGHLEVLKWLRSEGCPWNERTCEAAARHGHLDLLKYLHESGCPWNVKTCAWAAEYGHLDVLKYMHENGCPWNEWTCGEAARAGHLDVLKYAHENGCPWNGLTCEAAALKGHLDVIKYLHENGCPWNEGICEWAAARGHLDVLKYAHKNGCPWDEKTCTRAAREGHLDVLKYAHENGCPWDEDTWLNAAYSVREWLQENGCPQHYDEYDYYSEVEYGDGEYYQ